MADSQWTRKFTWLMDGVEVKGIVQFSSDQSRDGEDVDDAVDIVPDPNYRHLVSNIPGSEGVVHCETYPLDPADKSINREDSVSPWHLPKKPVGSPFMVWNPKTGEVQPLKRGDHVRLIGRWVIENGHPKNQRELGIRKIGDVFTEFHPFVWNDIRLVVPSGLNDVVEEILSLVAPTYTSVYVGQGKWAGNYISGVASWPGETPLTQRIYVNDDLSGFFNSQSARIQLSPLPLPSTGIKAKLEWKEEVLINTTNLPLDQVRTIAVQEDSIVVSATVTDPPLNTPGRNGTNGPTSNDDPGDSRLAGVLGNVNDPAYGYSVFQAKYSVWWQLSSLSQAATFISQNMASLLEPGQTYPATVTMTNTGSTTWVASGTSPYRLVTQNPQDNIIWGLGRVDVPTEVPPGATVTFNFTVTAPTRLGSYNFQWRMVNEGVEWFGDSTPNVLVFVDHANKNHKDGKDKDKDNKDDKDDTKDREKHPKDHEIPIHPLSSRVNRLAQHMSELESKMDQISQQLATGQAFIRPEERPPVGEQALNQTHNEEG